MSVTVEQLTKVYGDQKAVNNVSFQIKKGEVVGFLGPNGAGKSTTMKMITGYIPPSSGNTTVSGFDSMEQPLEVKRRIGYLPESTPLYYDMYVKEYLGFVGKVHKVKNREQRITQMIERTGLQREQHKKIGQLSKGYKQRVGLAQAMIHDPEVLILDEPTAGLDPNQLVDIRALITSLGKEKTVILSTHIMQEVQAMCDRVLIINKGQLVADNSTDKLREMAAGETIITVAFKENVAKEQLTKIKGIERVEAQGGEYRLSFSGTDDARELLFRFAVDEGYTLLKLNKEQSSLEQVFQKLTR